MWNFTTRRVFLALAFAAVGSVSKDFTIPANAAAFEMKPLNAGGRRVPAPNWVSGSVIELSPLNASALVRSGEVWLVQMYAFWSSECRRQHTLWEQVCSTLLRDFPLIKCARLHLSQPGGADLMDALEVEELPQIFLFRFGLEGVKHLFASKHTYKDYKEFLHFFKSTHAPVIHLRYFTSRGRAELIRLVLEVAELSYTQTLLQPHEWPAAKEEGLASGSLPFGQLPSLQYNGHELVQTMTIVRFLARRHGLLPSNSDAIVGDPSASAAALHSAMSDYEAAADMLLGSYGDLMQHYSDLLYAATDSFTVLRQAYVTSTLPLWLGHWERWLCREHGWVEETCNSREESEKLYFVAARLTVADLAVFDAVNSNLALDEDCLDKFPLLERHYRQMWSSKQLHSYLLSARRPEHRNGLSASFDNEHSPSWYARRFQVEMRLGTGKPSPGSLLQAEKALARLQEEQRQQDEKRTS